MTTTTAATSTPTPTPTPTPTSSTTTSQTAQQASQAAAQSIISTLNAGSGIDTGTLVTELVQAQYADKTNSLAQQASTATAQISAIAQLQSDITTFSTSLQSLISGGTLSTQPTTSNASVISASALSGAHIGAVAEQVEVDSLATAQSAATTTSFTSRSATVGTGTLTLTFGTATVSNGAMTGFTAGSAAPVTITIGDDNDTVDGIASAINAANAGVTATVVTDADGSARLMIKGQTGAAQAFTLSGDTPALQQLNVGVGQSATTIGTSAQNAQLKLDGVPVQRASNTVSDLITGVQLNLLNAAPGTIVNIGSTTPSANLNEAVNDFVSAYNSIISEITTDTAPGTGVLRQDPAVSALQATLAQLTLTQLTPTKTAGIPSTLAEIGVGTNKDGTLSVDATQLATAVATYPDAVEAMFTNGATASGAGLGGALSAMAISAANPTYGLAASTATYTATQSKIADDQSTLQTDEQTMTTRLTQQFSTMNSVVSTYKSQMSFLQQQIDAWNDAAKNS
jgi:flagellar hook-associated protein 2